MPTQDFVPTRRIDAPRHEQNMPEGVDNPVPESWVADRPGDEDSKLNGAGELFGNAGPNIGYAYTLVGRIYDSLILSSNEHRHDVEPLVAEIAMRRASHFGRAPIMKDVDCAVHLLGLGAELDNEETKQRVLLIHDCGHNEHKRRTIVNSIPDELLFGDKAPSTDKVSAWRTSIQH